MSLTNEQFNSISASFDRKRADNRRTSALRKAAVAKADPSFEELEDAITSASVRLAKASVFGESAQVETLKENLNRLRSERISRLQALGFASDYLDPVFSCPACRDEGFIDGQKCACFLQAEIDLLYGQANIRDAFRSDAFSGFDLSFYSEEISDPDLGITSRQEAERILAKAKNFTENFKETGENLFFYGSCGTGKTFLCNCIANELISRSVSCVYYPAGELFDKIASSTFSLEGGNDTSHLYDADLLIIDDLGTELTNAFTTGALFSLINERLLNRKSTVISTNLTPEQFAEVYSERIFSRILSSYTLLKFFGDDIRFVKKFRNKNS